MRLFLFKSASLILAILLASFSLCSCDGQPAPNNNTDDVISIGAYSAQSEFYQSLVSDLQQELLEEKENNYILECQYKLKIKELEQDVSTLMQKLKYVSANADIFPSNGYSDQSSSVSSPSFEKLSSHTSFEYVEENGEITITSYNGSEKRVTVPSFINNMPVTAIGDNAFEGSDIIEIALPGGIKTIGWFSFSGCLTLTSISIPSSVTYIGYGAFDLCPPQMTVVCECASYAEAYAKSWGLLTLLQ